jgi:hypothetical protein
MERDVDFVLKNHKGHYLVRASSEAARNHLAQHVPADAPWVDGSLVIEHRYWLSLALALRREGYIVKVED